jgi:hypothetical protein
MGSDDPVKSRGWQARLEGGYMGGGKRKRTMRQPSMLESMVEM